MEGDMPYVYKDAEALTGQPPVDNSQCVRLLQTKMDEIGVPLPHTSMWIAGEPVWGNIALRKGTCIATFEEGKYHSWSSGNHAAFYVGQDAAGIWMVEQYAGANAIGKVKRSTMGSAEFSGKSRINYVRAYYVIETMNSLPPDVRRRLLQAMRGMGGPGLPPSKAAPVTECDILAAALNAPVSARDR
jgi:hypothetical protein